MTDTSTPPVESSDGSRFASASTSTYRLGWELIRYRPYRFALVMAIWTTIHVSPLLVGLLVGRVFDRLVGDEASVSSAWFWAGLFGLFAIGRNVAIWIGEKVWIGYSIEQGLWVRRNLLRWLLTADGSRVLRSSPGEALSTFRDDVDDLVEYVESFVDGGGFAIYTVGSVAIMASIDATLTATVLAPLVVVVWVTRAVGPEIRARRRRMRKATEEVTGLLGETFGAVQAVKLAAAETPMLAELKRRNEVRRRAALKDTILTEALLSLNVNMSTLTIAIVMLMASGPVIDGSITVGDMVVFFVYLPRLTFYLAFVGHLIAQHRRTGVAYERIRRLAVDADDSDLLHRDPLPLDGQLGELPPRVRGADDRLQRLSVVGLTYSFPPTSRGQSTGQATGRSEGIHDVGFELEQGSFTVLAGKVGAGKTTILRALLGLVPAEGEVRWNDRVVNDRASFLVPPRSAYTPQIPQLFSETLAYNIALRDDLPSSGVHSAARLAVMDADLDRLAAGVETMVGARGVKLSGGQIQRSAVARMFATGADLLVFDDLSSALDLHTEAELWRRLFDHREATCLVVSHRPAALARADQILVVDDGRVVDRGTLGELLERSPVMAELWEASHRPSD